MTLRKWATAKHRGNLDNLLKGAIVVLAIAWFLSLSIANILRGPASADDAWIALAAKNLATGKGYATSLSDAESVHFDPFISTGPSLVLPAALGVRIFGNADWVPGAVSLSVFVVIFATGAILLVKRLGWSASSLFLATLMLLLTFASINNWYFGALLGEPIAFAFILLGVVLLSCWHGRWHTLVAGICFSFALLAKQIALFPVVGVVGAWFLIRHSDRRGGIELFKDSGALLFGIVSAAASFELLKIIQLGVGGYRNAIEATLRAGVVTEGGFGFVDRLESFLGIALDSYARPVFLPLVLVSILAAIWLLRKGASNERAVAKRLMFLASSGAMLHLGYVLFFSELWPRYLWIGLGLAFVAMAAAVLDATRMQRLALSLGLLLFLGAWGNDTASALLRTIRHDPIAAERENIVDILSSRPGVPYAAENWSSIYDVIFAMKREGTWRFGQGLDDLRGRKFTAVINDVHTNKGSMFYRIVEDTCRPLTRSKKFGLFECNDLFWRRYPT